MAGLKRADIEILRGNPNVVAAVANSLEFEHKYGPVVIAWAPEDRPTDAQVEAAVDELEKTAWAGLEADRYSWPSMRSDGRVSSPARNRRLIHFRGC